MKKAVFGMSFNWIFALIAGGFILFIAIYGASKFIQTSETTLYTETASKITSLLDPLETGLASGKATEILFRKESRFEFTCSEKLFPPFGKQTVSFSEQSFGKEFGSQSDRVDIKDKYIFTDNKLIGKNLIIFSKPFFLTFKVADLTIIFSDEYCFYNSPEEIYEDLEGLNIEKIIFMNSSGKNQACNGVKVCFDTKESCDIKVSYSQNYLIKEGKKLYYTDNLIYAAIFSSPEIYECNLKRLKNKFNELVKIYLTKIEIVERKGCTSNIGDKLASMNSTLDSSKEIILLSKQAEEIDLINKGAKSGCKLY